MNQFWRSTDICSRNGVPTSNYQNEEITRISENCVSKYLNACLYGFSAFAVPRRLLPFLTIFAVVPRSPSYKLSNFILNF